MPLAVDLVTQDFVENDVLRCPEEVALHLGNGLCKGGNQALGLQALGGRGLVRDSLLGEGFGEAAGALQKAQAVVVPPAYDIFLADQVHGADQLQTLEIGAAQLGHHALVLS